MRFSWMRWFGPTFGAALVLAPNWATAAPGELVGVEVNAQGNEMGYWEYLPEGYQEEGDPWPMLIYLGGLGQNGDGMLPPGECQLFQPGTDLCRMLWAGPVLLAWQEENEGLVNQWDDAAHPFVILAPQNDSTVPYPGEPYNTTELNTFVDYAVATYNIDPRQLHITGLSMGGWSASRTIVSNPGRFASATLVPGIRDAAATDPCNVDRTALWAFHGDSDSAPGFEPPQMTAWIDAINMCPGPRPVAQLTMYIGRGHNVWSPTYNLSGIGETVHETFTYGGGIVVDTVPYDVDLYTWMLQFDIPEIDAGEDVVASEDDDSFDLSATVTDFDAYEVSWTQVSGDPLTLTNADSSTLTVSDLVAGTYTFRAFVVDADNQYDEDLVEVEILEGTAVETETEGTTAGTSGGGDDDTGADAGGTDSAGDSNTDSDTATAGEDDGGGADGDGDGGGEAGDGGGDGAATGDTADAGSDGNPGGTSEGDTDAGQDGGAGGGGGCQIGGSNEPPAALLLGVFGAFALRRRRRA